MSNTASPRQLVVRAGYDVLGIPPVGLSCDLRMYGRQIVEACQGAIARTVWTPPPRGAAVRRRLVVVSSRATPHHELVGTPPHPRRVPPIRFSGNVRRRCGQIVESDPDPLSRTIRTAIPPVRSATHSNHRWPNEHSIRSAGATDETVVGSPTMTCWASSGWVVARSLSPGQALWLAQYGHPVPWVRLFGLAG